jgi:type IV secretory pathway component VirB8
MDQEFSQKFREQNEKLEAIYRSVEKTRKYFLWTLIVTIATIVLPLIALAFVIPWFLQTITAGLTL